MKNNLKKKLTHCGFDEKVLDHAPVYFLDNVEMEKWVPIVNGEAVIVQNPKKAQIHLNTIAKILDDAEKNPVWDSSNFKAIQPGRDRARSEDVMDIMKQAIIAQLKKDMSKWTRVFAKGINKDQEITTRTEDVVKSLKENRLIAHWQIPQYFLQKVVQKS